MRIAQVAPLYESVSPQAHGQTERVIAYLTNELVNQDHQVTLFASGDSVSQARLIAPCDQALRFDPEVRDPLAHHVVMMERMLQDAAEFDVVHFHMDYLHLPLVSRLDIQTLTTLHGPLDNPELTPLYRMFSKLPFVSISQAQRTPMPWLNWQDTIYYGLPEDLFQLHPNPGAYLAYLGPITPEQDIERAIEIAKLANMPLKISANMEQVDPAYLQMEIKPLLNDSRIEYFGEIDEAEKNEFLGQAAALLLPTMSAAPFPLASIEALACGTPVIASRQGVASEVIEHGVTGYLFDDVESAAQAVKQSSTLSRAACRKAFESRFTATRMAQNYLRVYDALLTGSLEPLAA